MTLTEFLLARIAEDEDRAQDYTPHWADCEHFIMYQEGGLPCTCGLEARMLAECEAKRQAIEAAWTDHVQIESEWGSGCGRKTLEADNDQPLVVRHLARPYADHPDYREEWLTASRGR